MNHKQIEILNTLVEIFSIAKLDKTDYNKIKEKFNILQSSDKEWADIENYVFQIMNKLKLIE